MTPAVVIDTNVIVAALLTRDSSSPTVMILDGMLAGRFVYLLSIELVTEYRTVLMRKKIRARHGLTGEEVDVVLTRIVANGIVREPDKRPTAPDPDDGHLWALLALGAGTLLVTGDQLLLDEPPAFASVVSPRSFIEMLAEHGA